MSIPCPTCSGPMQETLLRGVPIDRCTHCRMVWLDGGELAAVLGAGVRLPTARDDGHMSGSRCPRCAAPLVGRQAGVGHWEGCRRCGGSLMMPGTLALLTADQTTGRDRSAARARMAAGPTDPERLARISEEAWLGGPAVRRLPVLQRLGFLAGAYGWLLVSSAAFALGLAVGEFAALPLGIEELQAWGLVGLAVALVFARRKAPANAFLLCGFAAVAGSAVGRAIAGMAHLHGTAPVATLWIAAPWVFLLLTIGCLAGLWATARHAAAEFHLAVGGAGAVAAAAVFIGGLALGTGPIPGALFCAAIVLACIGFGSVDLLRHYTHRDAIAGAAHLWLLPVMALFMLWFHSDWRRAYWWHRWGRNRTTIPWEEL